MTLLIRADASVAIGTGHAMRCLALAQAWQDAGGKVTFAMARQTPAIAGRLAAESCEVVAIEAKPGSPEDASKLIAVARHKQADWVVVDGYCFDYAYQQALTNSGGKVIFVDDCGNADHYSADIILNQNIHAKNEMYADRDLATQLLLGPRYALLRREFMQWRGWHRDIPAIARRLLVMMGGSDPDNVTARVVGALNRLNGSLTVTVVIGGSNPHFAALREVTAQSAHEIRIVTDVANPGELMAQNDVCISAAGSTCWELCLLGMPSLVIDVAANQTPVARGLDAQGCAVHVGDQSVSEDKIAAELGQLLDSQSLRQSLSEDCSRLVDGEGADRVVAVLGGEDGLQLRHVAASDSRLLWEWANDPIVRDASYSPKPISWSEHSAWFETKLHEARRGKSVILIAERNAEPIGQIRFDARSGGGWEIDVSLAEPWRGKGFASRLIAEGVRRMRSDKSGLLQFHAFVKASNEASVKAFDKAGFVRLEVTQIRGHETVHLVCRRVI